MKAIWSRQRDLTTLYIGDDDPQMDVERQEFVTCIDAFVDQWKEADLTDVRVLRDALDDYERLKAQYLYGSREYVYWTLRDFVASSDDVKSRLSMADAHSREQMVRLQFFELKLWQIAPDLHDDLLDDAHIAQYRHYLERIWSAAQYDLSESEERILTMLSNVSYGNWADMIEDALKQVTKPVMIDGLEHDKTFEELMTLTRHDDKDIRDQAAHHIHAVVSDLSYMATRELNSVLEYKKIQDWLRGYARPDESRIVSEDIDASVIDSLIDAVSGANAISHRFYVLKARLLGQQHLAYHERNVPVRLSDQPIKEYPFDEGVAILTRVLEQMDPAFVAIWERMMSQWLIDVAPRVGKRGWAFNRWLGKDVINVVMLNYTNTLNDVTTLAHEMWHAINTQLVYQHQHALHASYGMFTAEVASQFLEDYVYDEVTADLDDIQTLEVMMSKLNDMISSIYRQIACYQYEQRIHELYRTEWFLSTDKLSAEFQSFMQWYMWPAVSQDPGAELWWVYWSHIRTYFYVFSYAGAMILAKALQSKVAAGLLTFEDIKNKFYAVGRNQSPLETFASLGIDIADPDIWKEWLATIEDDVKRAEQLADRLWL